MYLTAQRVRSSLGRTGVNVAFYRHRDDDLPMSVWSSRDADLLARVTQSSPGELVASRVAVAPGGNAVVSFLDIVAAEDTTRQGLEDALASLKPKSGREHARLGRVVVQFACDADEPDPLGELGALASAALTLFDHPTRPSWEAVAPMHIDVARDDEAWSYALSSEDAARVAASGGHPTRVRMRFDVAREFRETHGTLYPHVVQWVTALDADTALALGGARFYDGERLVGEWPRRTR